MPTPRSGETEQAFVSRCIPIARREGMKADQAAAYCYNLYAGSKHRREQRLRGRSDASITPGRRRRR